MKFQKKGAVEMSLNLIIMLIIGMVVLGLVIGFVNSLVSKGIEGFDDQIGENQQLKLNDVAASEENLAVLPEPSVEVKIGDKSNLFIKVRSFKNEIKCAPGDLHSSGNAGKTMPALSATTGKCFLKYSISDEEGTDKTSTKAPLILTGPGFNAKDGSEDSKMYTLKTTSDAEVGVYYFTLNLYGEESKTLTVTIK